jgi:hypothetical protein
MPEVSRERDVRALETLRKVGIVQEHWVEVTEDGLPYVVVTYVGRNGTRQIAPVPEERKWHYVDPRSGECRVKGETIAAICYQLMSIITRAAAEMSGMEVEGGTVQAGEQPFLVLRHPGPQGARRPEAQEHQAHQQG